MAERNYRPKRTARPENVKGTIWRMIRYMAPFRTHLIIVVFAVIVTALTNVASSYFFEPIINDYVVPFIGQKNVNLTKFALMLGVMAVIYLLAVFSSYLYRMLMSRVSAGILSNMRYDLFVKLQTMPMMYYDGQTHGEIMTRFTSDVETMRMLVSDTFPQVVNTIVQVAGKDTALFRFCF